MIFRRISCYIMSRPIIISFVPLYKCLMKTKVFRVHYNVFKINNTTLINNYTIVFNILNKNISKLNHTRDPGKF